VTSDSLAADQKLAALKASAPSLLPAPAPSKALIAQILSSSYKLSTPPISLANEIAALRSFDESVRYALAQYPTTEAQDQELWAKHEFLEAQAFSARWAAARDKARAERAARPPAAPAKSSAAPASKGSSKSKASKANSNINKAKAAAAAAAAEAKSAAAAGPALSALDAVADMELPPVPPEPKCPLYARARDLKEPLDFNLRNAVLLRMGEKSILRRILPFLKDAIALFELPYMAVRLASSRHCVSLCVWVPPLFAVCTATDYLRLRCVCVCIARVQLKAKRIEAVNARTATALQRYILETVYPLYKREYGYGADM
jgi:hypothetical protein